ncbi:hypothetical protein V499_09351 [Pseudogymnoascus sp. VKM F-103]|nr:hypothetical protein V499_09351 [Pseudogymnoascus sp. VKM F-103]
MTTITAGGNKITIPSWTTSTNLGPLPTTAFPSDCLNNFWNFNTPGLGMPWTQMTQGCAAKTCCPSGNVYTEPWAWMTSYYSPGVCPSQYRSCSGPPAPSALSSAPGETIAFCCPTNYNCPNTVGEGGLFQYCQSLLSTPTTVIVVDNIFDQKTLSTSSWTPASGLPSSWQAVYPIQVRIRANEVIPTATSTTETNSALPTGTQPPTETNSNPAQTSSDTSSSSSSSTPVGAIVGGVIGGLALLCIIAAFAIWMVIRSRNQRRNNPPLPPYNPQQSGPYNNGGGAGPILGGIPDKGVIQPLLGYRPPELQNQAIVHGPSELQNQAIIQGPPELQGQAVAQGPLELQNQAIVQGPPELQGQTVAQGPLELQNQAISQLHSQHRVPELSEAPSSAPPPQHIQGQWQFQPQMQEMWAPIVPPNSNPQGSHSA